MKIQTESFLMIFFKKLGFDSIAWSLRRLYCPVKKDHLVLEIGSGGNPYFRANVLCDAYFETIERYFEPLIYDRPTILAFAENLPFKDNVFDFVIASHVLEHSTEPERFLKELQRVAKAGYIETPDAVMERLTHYSFHRLEITEREGNLIIRKKKNYIQDEELAELFDQKAINVFPEIISKHPFHFHTRFYWGKENGGIRFRVINPEYQFDWESPKNAKDFKADAKKFGISSYIKSKALFVLRKIFSQNRRNRRINLADLMMCVGCGKSNFNFNGSEAMCQDCGKRYIIFGTNFNYGT